MSKENDAQFMRSNNHIYTSQQHNMPPRYTKPDPVKLNDYKQFVAKVTSDESNDMEDLQKVFNRLENYSPDVNISLLMTAAIGLGSETGEFQEIVKKVLFQGKELDHQTKFHMKRELGDILWYWINACRALDVNPDDVVLGNVEKLKSRYPEGEFSAFHSENRKKGDL